MLEQFAQHLPVLFGLLAALSLGVAVFVPSLRNPLAALLVLILALPFERVPSVDIAGVTLRFNQLAAVVLIVTVLLSIIFARRHIRPYPMLLPILAFLIFTMWTASEAINVTRATSVFVFVLLMFLTSVAIPQAFQKREEVPRVASILILLAAIVSVFGLFQFFGEMIGLPNHFTFIKEGYGREVFGFPRVHAFSNEPLYFANLLFLPIGVMVGLFLTKQYVVPRNWLIGILGATLVVFFLALSRGAFIAAVPFAFVIAFFFLRQFLTFTNIAVVAAGLAIVVALVLGVLGLTGPDAQQRFLEHATLQDVLVRQEGESGFGRLSTYDRALEIWQRAPLTGVGLGNYGPSVAFDPLTRPGTGWDIVNNQYLETLAETGIVGLFLTVLFWGWVVVRSFIAFFKTNDPLVRAVLGGLTAAFIAILVQYNFFSTLYIMHIWVALGLLVALQNIAISRKHA